MPRFIIDFYEEGSGNVYFDADSLAHAQELISEVTGGEMYLDDLPNAVRKYRNGDGNVNNLRQAED